jgi:hypothetical protein
MQHFHFHRAGTQLLATRQNAHGHSAAKQFLKRSPYRGGGPLLKRRCATDLAHGESIEERRQSVEVIEISVRQKDFIDSANAAVP